MENLSNGATPKRARGEARRRPEVAPPLGPEDSAGLFYFGFVATVLAAIAGIVGAVEPGARVALVVAGVVGLVGSLMIAVAVYRAMRSIDYLARERFYDQNG